jgi:hypothetical protein
MLIGSTLMQNEPFREPVTVYLKHADGVLRPTRICTTQEAYKALTSGDPIPIGEPEWHVALRAIVKALLDPKAENIEASRRALQRLANLTATPAAAPRRTIH